MLLEWSDYRHFPYERELAIREAVALLGAEVHATKAGEVSAACSGLESARLLTYFSSAKSGNRFVRTLQADLERSVAPKGKRQSTRYSVHGLHEYRGKFNPQICAALINILGLKNEHRLLDPFCGSGTTLVEATHRGIESVGSDLNPLAVFIANAKLQALSSNPDALTRALDNILDDVNKLNVNFDDTDRMDYLKSWFEIEQLTQIEKLREAISIQSEDSRPIFFVVASNLLRDFSLQEPADLRIRRRASANAQESFLDAFERACRIEIRKLRAALDIVGASSMRSQALLVDNRELGERFECDSFDAAITSPPYATALPYIDTQRLSLVWLDLIKPTQIGPVEAALIGSREMRPLDKRQTLAALRDNSSNLPASEAQFCLILQDALGKNDGFRRQAVPILIYRYFTLMSQTFSSVRKCIKPGGKFALIVGHNHTQLGGRRIDIDTPTHLASLAKQEGWTVEELTALQPYQRYGLHAANAVKAETLIILRA